MSAKITYGFVFAFVGIALTLIGYLLGLQTDRAGSTLASLFGWLGTILSFFVLWLGVRAVRDEKPDQCLTFGQGVGAGVVIALVGAVIGAVYTLIHLSFINPDFADHMMVAAQQKWEDAGMSAQQMEVAERMTRVFFHPGIMAGMGFLGQIFFGTIFSLIVAAIVKRNPPAPNATLPPPPPVPPAMPPPVAQ
ncbi:MAG: DUF4199 domain-containing protein [Opitutaceae bacterium]|jgi:hypothetical protein|nr:DUF4199 domain-containing protein [Opitutaceae bacterium]